MLIRCDESGNVKWLTSIGGDSLDYFSEVSNTNDGGYVVGGYFTSDSIEVNGQILEGNGKTGVIINTPVFYI